MPGTDLPTAANSGVSVFFVVPAIDFLSILNPLPPDVVRAAAAYAADADVLTPHTHVMSLDDNDSL